MVTNSIVFFIVEELGLPPENAASILDALPENSAIVSFKSPNSIAFPVVAIVTN